MSGLYADCQLAIEVQELIIADLARLEGIDFWATLIDNGIGPVEAHNAMLKTVDKAIENALLERRRTPTERRRVIKQVNLEMRLPSFRRWVAGKLGAV